MITWLAPGALWFLLAAGGPVIAHLLSRRHATLVDFPTLRFVGQSHSSAVRVRRPADLLLLLLRIAIVACAAVAAAQPVIVTPRRLAAWDQLVARAVVVEQGEGRAETADALAERELQGARYGRRLDVRDVNGGIRAAAAWLEGSPPARREIVVISPLRLGSVNLANATVPPSVGMRLVRAGDLQPSVRFAGEPLLERAQEIMLDGPSTTVRIRPVPSPGGDVTASPNADGDPAQASEPRTRGIRFIARERDRAAIADLVSIAAEAGAPAPSAEQPLAFAFDETPVPGDLQPLRGGWRLATAIALRSDDDLTALARPSVAPGGETGDDAWTTLFTDDDGSPVVRVAASDRELVIRVESDPASLISAAVVRGALRARTRSTDLHRAHEVLTIPETDLVRAGRAAGPVTRARAAFAESSDARWFWLAALVLLIVEWRGRGRVRRTRTLERDHAA